MNANSNRYHGVLLSIDTGKKDGFAFFRPASESEFCVYIDLECTMSGQEGSDLFQMGVCTQEWIDKHKAEASLGFGLAHYLVVQKWDYEHIFNQISAKVNSCIGNTWREIALQINEFAYWEMLGTEPG